MDTSFYFIRCKGEEKGPYAFYQIQQMRTEDVLTRADFTPEEWEQFEQFIDDGGDVPLARTGTPTIRKVDKNAVKKSDKRLVIALTYLSYAIGGFVILGALLQGEQDYILQSRPLFWLGWFFSVMLCHTAVDGLCHRQLERYPRSSRLDLFVKYLLVLGLFALAFGAVIAAEKYLGIIGFNREYTLGVVKKYFGLAALISVYRPFYLGFLSEHGYLKPRRKSSVPWLLTLLGWVAMLLIYLAPTSGFDNATIGSVRDALFAYEGTILASDGSDWKFPIHLGDTQKAVQRILGKPQIIGEDYVYPSLRISFDQQRRVTRLHFDGRDLQKSVLGKKQLVATITPAGSFREMKSVLGSKNVTFGDQASETHIWELPGYRIAACFWSQNNPADRALMVKWLDVSVAQ